ncbi:MAG: TetR/AcrR family transcriptional regulator [Bacillota bacterium]|nr:TetR/AcrR family transcriptional regulator [Bacillota bacterium]
MSRWADQKISIAFVKMLRKQPVDDVTVIKVCEKAGVNRQSFYYHFKDMNELIQYIVRNKLEKYIPKENIYHRWPECLEKIFDYSRKHKSIILNIYNSSYKADFIITLNNYSNFLVKHALEQCLRETKTKIDKEEIAFLETITGLTFVGIYQLYLENGLTEDPAKVASWCAKVFRGSFGFIIAKSKE